MPDRPNAVRDAALRRFADAFARGAHWDAHEHLEELWRDDREDLWQALIQLAAAFVLLHSGRNEGALRVLARAQEKLAPLPASRHGVDVAWLRLRYAAFAKLLSAAPQTPTHSPASLFTDLPARLGLPPTLPSRDG